MDSEAPAPSSPRHPAPSRTVQRLGGLAMAASLALCLFVSACYALRPDACAAVTVWPVWAWAVPGLLLVALAWRLRRTHVFHLLVVVWLAYVLVFAEEPRSLARGLLRPLPDPATHPPAHGVVRVVSLNCAGGSPAAAAEVAAYHPGVVLLQESPNSKEVVRLARDLYGPGAAAVPGPDGSVIAPGPARTEPLTPGQRMFFAAAVVRLPSGIQAEVISVRLLPPVFREDLWNASCWREQTANRRLRREQVRELAAFVDGLPPAMPIILGGDLNAPARDGALQPLSRRLEDAFPAAGRGWGDTITNEAPALRIDQVWLSRDLRPVAVWARRTANSDHRMVICDLRPVPR